MTFLLFIVRKFFLFKFFFENFLGKIWQIEVFRRLLTSYFPISYLSRKRLHCQGRTFFVIYYLTCSGSFLSALFSPCTGCLFSESPLCSNFIDKFDRFFLHCSANAKDFFFLNSYCHLEFLFKLFVKSVSKWDFLKIIKLRTRKWKWSSFLRFSRRL